MDKFIITLNNVSLKDNPTIKEYEKEIHFQYPNHKGKGIKLIESLWINEIKHAPKKYSLEWSKAFKALDKAIKNIYPNEGTAEKKFGTFRKPLKLFTDKEIYKQSIYQTGISRERSIELKKEYSEKVKQRNKNRKSLPVIYVEDILKLINELIKGDTNEKILAIKLATASRSIEVLKISNYKKVKDPQKIQITGLAKNPDSKITIQRNLIGLNSSQVIANVRKIRKKLNFKDLTNEEIATMMNKKLNILFRKVFKDITGDNEYTNNLTAHKTRYISGNVSYELYGRPENIPYESYLQEQYGHSNGESTKSYLGINIKLKKNEKKTIKKKPLKKEVKKPLKKEVKKPLKKEDKIQNVVNKLKELKQQNKKMIQKELRKDLGYAASIMTEGYKKARILNII